MTRFEIIDLETYFINYVNDEKFNNYFVGQIIKLIH